MQNYSFFFFNDELCRLILPFKKKQMRTHNQTDCMPSLFMRCLFFYIIRYCELILSFFITPSMARAKISAMLNCLTFVQPLL